MCAAQPAAIFLPMCRAAVTCIESVGAENRQGEQVATRRGVPLLFNPRRLEAGSDSGVCQDEGALCLRFRNHPGLMSMTETPINSEIREKPHRFVLPGAWKGRGYGTVSTHRGRFPCALGAMAC